ncbi:hypothetical protein [Sphingobacterium sp. UBA6320]|uniref:hypothetical protein n=1 Tax=Sphingobacterium sp. UBA6320 TaxID=1947510 RepID=UPI0025EE2632|nr:hypothetical protein [Sphingobacterium sp. UBA6320]
MRKIVIIGSGLTGCQLLTKTLIHNDLSRLSKLTQIELIDLCDAVEKYQSLSLNRKLDKIVLTSIRSCIPDLGPYREKKPKYRQQHKLAQRNYRRK